MDTRLAILLVLVAAAMALIGIIVQQRAANRRRPIDRERSPYVALWEESDRYRRQVANHVAWRRDGRPGKGPLVEGPTFDVAAFAVALQSPGPIAEAAGALSQQTELLGKTFVRDDADPWAPDPEEWEAMIAEWQIRASNYADLAHVDRGDPSGAEGTHRHSWSRTYTIRRRRTGGWLLEYDSNPSEIVVLPEGSVSAGGTHFRECEACGTWESRDGSRGNWQADPYSGDSPSPRVQLLDAAEADTTARGLGRR
jgi:hypothetical protein